MEIRYFKKMEQSVPNLIAAWPGMGMLAVLVVDHLKKKLGGELILEVNAPLNSIAFKDGMIKKSHISNKFFISDDKKHIFCIGDSQPLTVSEVLSLAETIIEVAKSLHIERIITTAATLSRYEGIPQVYGIVTHKNILDFLKEKNILPAFGVGRITGLNGVLLEIAKKANIEGICLLGQIKFMDIPQPRSAIEVLKKIMHILQIQIDFAELEEQANKIEGSLKKVITPRSQMNLKSTTRHGEDRNLDYIG